MSIGFELGELSAAAYTTAEVTGAFGHREYDAVRRFAAVYDLQRKYDALQDESVSYVTAAAAPAASLDDPGKIHAPQLEDWKARLEQAMAALFFQQRIAEKLRDRYAQFLAAEGH
ncbi:MAG TPA: hypothetical protein VFO94_12765 [Gammaproteobacteria bacterium]|nr:hypothetical protein [Gammaproteobacteria bacterium]